MCSQLNLTTASPHYPQGCTAIICMPVLAILTTCRIPVNPVNTHSSCHMPTPPQGCTAIICMPVNTPEIKVANVRKLGGTVVLVGESYQEAQVGAGVWVR